MIDLRALVDVSDLSVDRADAHDLSKITGKCGYYILLVLLETYLSGTDHNLLESSGLTRELGKRTFSDDVCGTSSVSYFESRVY